MRRHEGRVAVVTGGTKGIGLAVARRLGLEGAAVVLCSRREANVREAVAGLRAAGVARVDGLVCHVGTEEARRRLVGEAVRLHGRIDVLVSNVATNPIYGPMLETTDERAWDKIMDVNVKAAFFLVRAAYRHMPRGGSVVIVASVGGYLPFADLGAYSVSKTALLGLTRALAPELGARGVTVNCLAPGVIKTRFSEALWKERDGGRAGGAERPSPAGLPAGRFGTPDDCAAAVAYMSAPEASYMTGETVLVTGGMQARL